MDSTAELEKLREQLAMCQAELAKVRAAQEKFVEREPRLLRRATNAEERRAELARSVVQLLHAQPSETAGARSRGRGLGALRRTGPELPEDVTILEGSDLFDAEWYVATHPDAVASGLRPAAHYLEVGARAGLNPGPEFDTEAYRAEHPELGRKENPLLHHLRSGAQ